MRWCRRPSVRRLSSQLRGEGIGMMTEASFTEVFNLYYPKVYYHFLKKTRSASTAREVAQLSFIKLWEFRHTLKDTIPLDIQLFHIAAGVFIDYLRRENTQRKKVEAVAAEVV